MSINVITEAMFNFIPHTAFRTGAPSADLPIIQRRVWTATPTIDFV